MSFEEFQDGCHLGYLNRKILAFLNLYMLRCPPSSFGSTWLMVWEEMSFEEFQAGSHGDHLGYQNRTISAILCHCDASHQVLAQSDLQFRRCRLKKFFSLFWGFYSPLKNISFISNRSFIKGGQKREVPGKTPDHPYAELGFPTCDPSKARTTAVRNLID